MSVKHTIGPITDEQRPRLRRLSALPEADIDTSDAPEGRDWWRVFRGTPRSTPELLVAINAIDVNDEAAVSSLEGLADEIGEKIFSKPVVGDDELLALAGFVDAFSRPWLALAKNELLNALSPQAPSQPIATERRRIVKRMREGGRMGFVRDLVRLRHYRNV